MTNRKSHPKEIKEALNAKSKDLALAADKRLTMARNESGLYTGYPDEVWDEILDRISAGQLFKRITDDLGLNDYSIMARVYRDHNFAERVYDALGHGMLSIGLETIDIADGGHSSSGDVARDRLMIDTRKWLAERLNKRFQNRPMVEAQNITIQLPDQWRDMNF